MRYMVLALATAAALPATAQGQEQRDDQPFRWSERVPAGSWLRIRNLNGPIRVAEAAGDRAEVTGEKRWRRGDPSEVRFEVIRDGSNVTICALWGSESQCDAEGYRHERGRHDGERSNDTSVEFTVRLPRGVRLHASTVNGRVEVRGATSEVVARTVNGGIDAASSGGPVTAGTVNGNVDVRMGARPGARDLEYSTVNGSIAVEVPAGLNARLDMSTVNGRISTDFPITVSGRISPRRLSADIGSGGPRIKLRTVNGSIELRRAR